MNHLPIRHRHRVKKRKTHHARSSVHQLSTVSPSRRPRKAPAPAPRSRLPTNAHSSWQEGYSKGWSDGFRLGASHSIMHTIPVPAMMQRPIKVMFVRENSTGYHLIERGIISALQKAVRELVVVCTLDPIAEIAAREMPDLMLVLNGIFVLQPETLEAIRALGIRTAAWFADDPYFLELSSRLVPHFDDVFTHEAGVVDYYRGLGGRVHYLPFAAPVEHAGPVQVEQTYWSDVCLIGSGFPNRIAFIDRIAPYLKKLRVYIAGGLWNQLKSYRHLGPWINLGGVPVEEAVKYYNGAKIVLNLHRTHELGGLSSRVSTMSVNPRTFEINACASLQLTDIRADLPSLYTPGSSIETYGSAEECIEKIHYYLRNEQQRLDVALRGYRTTKACHTYEHRMANILHTIYEG